MATGERVRNALRVTRMIGIPDEEAKLVLKRLLKMFDNNWEPIEAEEYRALLDTYFEMKDNKVKDKEVRAIELDGSGRPSKKMNVEEKRDRVSCTMDRASHILSSRDRQQEDIELSRPIGRERTIKSELLLPHNQSNDKGKNPTSSYVGPRDGQPVNKTSSCSTEIKQPPNRSGFSCDQGKTTPYSNKKTASAKPKTELSADDSARKSIYRDKLSNYSGSSNISDQVAPCNLQIGHAQKKKVGRIVDITKGTESVEISLVDETNKEDLPKFTYIPQNIVYQNAYVHVSLARIADEDCCSSCKGDCLSSPLPCACARETGGEFAYTKEGLLREEFLDACISMKTEPDNHPFVYCQDCPLERSNNDVMPEKCKGHLVRKFIKECWRKCGCDMRCGNRMVQRGITCKLQVFLTHEDKGWGVRALQDLPKGTFICEYVGEVLTNLELYERNLYSSGNERHTYPVTLDADWGSEKSLKDEEALCLDATLCGNVARFINHRCFDANVIDIPVEVETPDRHYYHLAFFTSRNVRAFEELTWDYGIDFSDHDHPIKAFKCRCGSRFCRDKTTKKRSRKYLK